MKVLNGGSEKRSAMRRIRRNMLRRQRAHLVYATAVSGPAILRQC